MKPEAAVARLTRAALFAHFTGAKFLNSDEMLKPDWMERKQMAGDAPWSWCMQMGICGYISIAAKIRWRRKGSPA